MSTKIIGNQIDATTRAIIEALQVTEQINLPSLNQTQVNALGAPAYGTLIYNNTEDMAQIYKQDAAQGVPGWDDVGGGGPSVGENSIIRTNGPTIEENLTIGPVANGGAEFTNGFSAGPVSIANGFTVTIENGATWNIIGGEDYEGLEVASVISGSGDFSQLLHWTTTKEAITYYQTSGTVTHDFNSSAVVYVQKTGGGNFTLNLNNLPTTDEGGIYRFTVIIENAGGNGVPTTLNINGVNTGLQWRNSGTSSHSYTFQRIEYYIIARQPPGEDDYFYTVLAGDYGNNGYD